MPVSHDTIRRIESHTRTGDGAELFIRTWLPLEPTRVLVIVHGFGEHSGRYEELATWYARRRFVVYAFDLRGHGRSPGRRGHVDAFDVLLDDLEGVLAFASDQHARLPRVLLGHSMGGLISAAFVCEREVDIDRFVASGPALALSPAVSSTRLRLFRLLARVVPRLTMEAGLAPDGLSRDPEVVHRYEADPLVHGRISAALGAGMLDAQIRTSASASRVPVATLLLHGEDDPLCPVDASRRFFEGLPRDRVAGSELRTYPGLRHEIFNEPERESVYEDLLAWLDKPI